MTEPFTLVESWSVYLNLPRIEVSLFLFKPDTVVLPILQTPDSSE